MFLSVVLVFVCRGCICGNGQKTELDVRRSGWRTTSLTSLRSSGFFSFLPPNLNVNRLFGGHSGIHRGPGRQTHPEHPDRRADGRAGAHRLGYGVSALWADRGTERSASAFSRAAINTAAVFVCFFSRPPLIRCGLRAGEDPPHPRDRPLQAVPGHRGRDGHHRRGGRFQEVSCRRRRCVGVKPEAEY